MGLLLGGQRGRTPAGRSERSLLPVQLASSAASSQKPFGSFVVVLSVVGGTRSINKLASLREVRVEAWMSE